MISLRQLMVLSYLPAKALYIFPPFSGRSRSGQEITIFTFLYTKWYMKI
jgi:hypothetical protein